LPPKDIRGYRANVWGNPLCRVKVVVEKGIGYFPQDFETRDIHYIIRNDLE
jgi:hypothetical protein